MGRGIEGETIKTSLDGLIHKLDYCQLAVDLLVWLRIVNLGTSVIMDVKLSKPLKLSHAFYVGRLAHLCLSYHDPFLTDLPNHNALPADVSQLQSIAVNNPVCDLELHPPILLEYGNTPQGETSNQQKNYGNHYGSEDQRGFIVIERRLAEFLRPALQFFLVATALAINYTLIDRLHLRQYFTVTFYVPLNMVIVTYCGSAVRYLPLDGSVKVFKSTLELNNILPFN